MPITRKFIDWSQPALTAIVDDLRHEYTVLGSCDLSKVIAVVPGRQAGRRFQEILTVRTNGHTSPPRIVTASELPELLYSARLPFATDLTQRLAWGEALRKVPTAQLQAVLRNPPADQDLDGWLALGELLARQHRELAADLMSFADVAERGSELEGFNERERWSVLREVQQHYLNHLDALGVWDQQTARLVAVDKRECKTTHELLLIGTVDLNQTVRAMLDQVADRVTAYIHAPEQLKRRFDSHGCLIPEAWAEIPIDLDTEQIQVVDGPLEQADAVARALARWEGKYAADEVTIGVPDERLVPHVRRLLHQCDIPTRWVVDRTLPQTEPYLFLQAVAHYLDAARTEHFAALVRHPDVSVWLDQQGLAADWLAKLDQYITTHLPLRIRQVIGTDADAAIVAQLISLIDALLEPLRGPAQLLSEWSEPITNLLLQLYDQREFDRELVDDRAILDACGQLRQALITHTKIPATLEPAVTGTQAIQLTLEQVRGGIIPAEIEEAAVQVYGWLELPLDDAPALIVTSLNEGFIPAAVNHDLFLPNRLRTHLGLEDNSRRYARDAYALSVLAHSRKQLTIIAGKRDVQGEPLVPSRLLFATDPSTIAQRLLSFYEPHEQSVLPPLAGPLTAQHAQFQFAIPRPEPRVKPPWAFSVTEFSDYLLSPYRYYLRRVLWLQEVSDDVAELDPAGFGNLIHHVLDVFGQSEARHSSDPVKVLAVLEAALEDYVNQLFGSQPQMTVRVQVEQARSRLGAFARWNAGWVAQGWEQRFAEVNPPKYTFRLPDGRSVKLRGRIDRIDYHPGRNEWAIFDYKTGERAGDPDKAHREQGQWINLQLPLYRHLAKPLGVTGKVHLGYISLPRDTNEIQEHLADWTEEELREADQTAQRVIQQILDEKFWIPDDNPPTFMQELAPICQDGVFGKQDSV
ncbi:MAG: PD-(D/E)XK nuclease family protein [Planctomycetaceae bacterium]|nr:PD-(D/E)XK nuclease family protein [Planctomycetaceae bacterium]